MRIKFIRGDTERIKFELTDVNGNELILSPTTEIRFSVKRNFRETLVLFQKKLNDGIEYIDNYFVITIRAIDTEGLEPSTYMYDLEIRDGEEVKTLAIDELILLPDITTKRNVV
jgi:hypothetical protein